MSSFSSTYKYDLAISLCKQDVEFARKLVKLLNPKLNVFFYEDRQEELITNSGPEAFGRVFKEESRVVLILSRKEWGESYYTAIERNAVVDRTSRQDQGHSFIMMMPMEQGEIPSWYPSTLIYANPSRFQIEDLARFIEFKITEQGGEVKPLTTKEQYEHLLARIEQKKALVRLQETPEAIEKAKSELSTLRKLFNERTELLKQAPIGQTSTIQFYPDANSAFFQLVDYRLDFRFHMPDEILIHTVTTQDVWIKMELKRLGEPDKIVEEEARVFYYSSEFFGWSLPVENKIFSEKELQVLFHDRKNQEYYDLGNPLKSLNLMDMWFKKLLSLSSQNIERFL